MLGTAWRDRDTDSIIAVVQLLNIKYRLWDCLALDGDNAGSHVLVYQYELDSYFDKVS